MHRYLLILLCMGLLLPTQAQENPPPTLPPAMQTAIADAQSAAERAELAAMQAAEDADDAAMSVDIAGGFLGLFEVLGVFITIVVGAAGGFGILRLVSAQRDLAAARAEIEKELEQYRERFASETEDRRNEVKHLNSAMEQTVREQRETTSMALLANAMMPLGERQYRTQDYEGALNTYNRALELDPQNPVVHQRLGYVYTQSGDLDRAKFHYEQAINLEEDFAPALAGLGFVFRRFGEGLESKIDQAVHDETRRNLRIERDEWLNRAEANLLRALKLSPKLVDDDGESWWGVLGGLYKRREQINEAIEAYHEATRVTPQSSYGYGNLALLYLRKRDRDNMLTMYARVERIAEAEAKSAAANFWGYADLIVSRFALGKTDEAMQELPIAVELAPLGSPYMLMGLQETLADLLTVTPDEQMPIIQQAIDYIRTERDRRDRLTAEQEGETPAD